MESFNLLLLTNTHGIFFNSSFKYYVIHDYRRFTFARPIIDITI